MGKMKGNVQGMAELSQSSQFCQPFRKDSRFTTQRKADVVRNTETSVVSPKCARCKNHGFICPLKGHKGLCKWKNCTCPNCSLIIERQKIMAAEQSVLKEMAKQTRSSRGKEDLYEFASQNTPQNEDITKLKGDMTGVREYICLHFGSEEARATMVELEKWHEKDPQPCYINILRRLFPDIKMKVLQLLLAACDGDLIKTVETILPCCKKTKNNGQVTYIKASSPPQKMMLLSRTQKFPTRVHDKRDVFRYSPYTLDGTHGRCPTFPGIFIPPYAHAPVTTNKNCGLCVPGFVPPYYFPGQRISREEASPRSSYPYYTTPKCNFSECKTVTSGPLLDKDDTRTSAAATLISLSNS